jgi:hypothetical protein
MHAPTRSRTGIPPADLPRARVADHLPHGLLLDSACCPGARSPNRPTEPVVRPVQGHLAGIRVLPSRGKADRSDREVSVAAYSPTRRITLM